MMTWINALSRATSVPARKASIQRAWRLSVWPLGSITINCAPRLAAFLMNVAATGWLTVGFEPMTTMTSELAHSENGAVTAPEPIVSINAATDEAWQSRVQ